MEKQLKIHHEFYESTIGQGPCGTWQGPIDVAEAEINLPDGKVGYAVYRKEAGVPAVVSYSVYENSYFAEHFNPDNSLERHTRLNDAKKSVYGPVFQQLYEKVKEAASLRKGSPSDNTTSASTSSKKKVSTYAALFRLDGETLFAKGKTPSKIVEKIMGTDSAIMFAMLLSEGYTENDVKSCRKLNEVFHREVAGELTIDEVKKFNIHCDARNISLKCSAVAEGAEAVKELRAKAVKMKATMATLERWD